MAGLRVVVVLCLAALILPALVWPIDCRGYGCLDNVAFTWISALLYAAAGVIIAVKFWKGKFGSGGAWLAVVVTLAFGSPLLSWSLQYFKNETMFALETWGEDLRLADRRVLHLHISSLCSDNPCDTVATYMPSELTLSYIAGGMTEPDFSRPVDLTTLELELYGPRGAETDTIDIPALASSLDYVVITRPAYYAAGAQGVDRGLQENPQFAGVSDKYSVAIAFGSLAEPGVLDLANVNFDFIDLDQHDRALSMPFVFGDTGWVLNGMQPEAEAVAHAAICGDVGSDCETMLRSR